MTFLQKIQTLALQVQRHAWNAQNLLIKKTPVDPVRCPLRPSPLFFPMRIRVFTSCAVEFRADLQCCLSLS